MHLPFAAFRNWKRENVDWTEANPILNSCSIASEQVQKIHFVRKDFCAITSL